MNLTDPVADFLTRIRNAIHASHETVRMPASRVKAELARILAEQGYIDAYHVAAAVDARAGDSFVLGLGVGGAAKLISNAEDNPQASGARLFPNAAAANRAETITFFMLSS